MTPEVKLRTLASGNSALVSRLGTSPFRWFDIQLDQRLIRAGTCVRVRRVTTSWRYMQAGRVSLQEIYFQIDVLDADPETARAAATDVVSFLAQVDLTTNAQFGSPTTTPKQYPCYVVNQRAGLEPIPDPPVYVQSIDVRIYNEE